MTADLRPYEASKDFCLTWFKTKGAYDVPYSVSVLAGVMFIPAIVIACWLGELTEWNEASVSNVETLIKFYEYTSIAGLPVNAPVFFKNS